MAAYDMQRALARVRLLPAWASAFTNTVLRIYRQIHNG